MATYRVFPDGRVLTIEADEVNFNLEYGMMFFVKGEEKEVVASLKLTTPMVKLSAHPDPSEDDDDGD